MPEDRTPVMLRKLAKAEEDARVARRLKPLFPGLWLPAGRASERLPDGAADRTGGVNHEPIHILVAEVRAWVEANGLTLHPTKTHVGDCRVPGQGFEFLGYRFEAGRRLVRKKSLDKLKDSIRAKTGRNRGDSLERIIADLNRTLRGWFGYFKHAHPNVFGSIDGSVRRRLRSLLLKQRMKRSHVGQGLGLSRLWPNAYFAEHGLFALHAAWVAARQSR